MDMYLLWCCIVGAAAAATSIELVPSSAHVARDSDYTQACSDEFGPDASVADWDTIITALSDAELQTFYSEYDVQPFGKRLLVVRDGSMVCNEGVCTSQAFVRKYFVERHDGNPPSSWDVFGQHAGLTLGSWHGGSMQVLCAIVGTTTTTTSVYYDCSALPMSMNGYAHPYGCPGAVWADGSPSLSYCEGRNGLFPWWSACCHWDGSACAVGPASTSPSIATTITTTTKVTTTTMPTTDAATTTTTVATTSTTVTTTSTRRASTTTTSKTTTTTTVANTPTTSTMTVIVTTSTTTTATKTTATTTTTAVTTSTKASTIVTTMSTTRTSTTTASKIVTTTTSADIPAATTMTAIVTTSTTTTTTNIATVITTTTTTTVVTTSTKASTTVTTTSTTRANIITTSKTTTTTLLANTMTATTMTAPVTTSTTLTSLSIASATATKTITTSTISVISAASQTELMTTVEATTPASTSSISAAKGSTTTSAATTTIESSGGATIHAASAIAKATTLQPGLLPITASEMDQQSPPISTAGITTTFVLVQSSTSEETVASPALLNGVQHEFLSPALVQTTTMSSHASATSSTPSLVSLEQATGERAVAAFASFFPAVCFVIAVISSATVVGCMCMRRKMHRGKPSDMKIVIEDVETGPVAPLTPKIVLGVPSPAGAPPRIFLGSETLQNFNKDSSTDHTPWETESIPLASLRSMGIGSKGLGSKGLGSMGIGSKIIRSMRQGLPGTISSPLASRGAKSPFSRIDGPQELV